MAERKSFLLRVDREVLDAVQRWANDDLRSLNSQVEYLLREALKRGGRPVQRSEDQLLTDISDAPYGAEE
ncbi:MAG: Arc family DNA-binding protein [bacterium]|nr:Arc family DNA-binding protein [bacterium]